MGEVYLAEDSRLRRMVALKVLQEKIAADADRLRRFEREAHSASALNHPNILTVYEFGEQDGKHFLASEYVKGKTLGDMIFESRIKLRDALEITIQIASALQAAHAAGIIHRDIKPDNVMIREDGYVKVLDFGLAKLFEQESIANPHDPTRVDMQTKAGIVMGTAPYMSPEQARGGMLDARTDIFSLGAVLYEILTRRQPFSGETINHTIVAVLEQEPMPIASHNIQVPIELERIVFKALAKKVNERYQTAKDLIDDLKSMLKRLDFEAEFERSSPTNKVSNLPTQILNLETNEQIQAGATIAVLPFVNMSPNEDGDYLSDGIAEELINVLSKISGLRVAARTSAFSFKGRQKTIAEIGKALNVESVLEGSIRMAGSRVRISVQLVKVEDGYHYWSETYDHTMDDIFQVQDDIALSVLAELRERLLGRDAGADIGGKLMSEVAAAARGRATNPEAQRLMLLGRYFLDRTTKEDTEKAIGYFKEALDLDPEYALCWAELGKAFSIQAGRVWISIEEGFELSRQATERALLLEPNLAEGHAQLGRIQVTYDWNFQEAQSSYQRAVNLAPLSSSVLDGASLLEYRLGRLDEALELSRRVSIQDPLSAAFWHNLGLTCHAAGVLAESEKAFKRALELAPQRFVSNALLSLVLLDQERAEDAVAQAMLEPYEMWRLWALVIIYSALGRKTESDELLGKLKSDYSEGNAYQIAEAHSIRRETDLAFEWLEKAFAERDSGLTHAKVNPRFLPLHSDPRWATLLKKIGFDL